MSRLVPLLLFALLSGNVLAQEALRGVVKVDLEPVYALDRDVPYPLDDKTAHTRALNEGQLFFAGMIYGWSFYYDIGERARGIAEEIALEPLGRIEFGDPQLKATDAEVREGSLYLWMDYELNPSQRRRTASWRAGTIRNIDAIGYGPLGGPVESSDWIVIKRTALEDAVRSGVRSALRGSERNRPKAARGFIALAAFPHYRIDAGRWTVSAKFRLDLQEIIPFAVY